MKIIINNADTTEWDISINECNCPDDLNLAALIAQTIDFNYTYIQRHHGCAARTITDLVEHINDGY